VDSILEGEFASSRGGEDLGASWINKEYLLLALDNALGVDEGVNHFFTVGAAAFDIDEI
jgi:hypothetical protein